MKSDLTHSAARQTRCGFSLVEMLASVAIIGIIAFLAIPSVSRMREDSERNLAIARAESLNVAQATMVQTQLRGTNARAATFTGANMANLDAFEADFSQAKMEAAVLQGAGLNETRWAGASLTRADFTGARCRNAGFEHSRLLGARFDDADLRGAQFDNATVTGVSFWNADVRGTDFFRAKGFDTADLTGARYDRLTIWPNESFDPAAAGCVFVA